MTLRDVFRRLMGQTKQVAFRDQEETNTEVVYYSLKDQKCGSNCPSSCKSKMKSFIVYKEYFKGEYLDRTKNNLIGEGGFGRVYRGLWHGQSAAFKFVHADYFVPVGKILKASKSSSDSDTNNSDINDTDLCKRIFNEKNFELEKDIKEYTSHFQAEGDSVLMPIGHFRQQSLFRNN